MSTVDLYCVFSWEQFEEAAGERTAEEFSSVSSVTLTWMSGSTLWTWVDGSSVLVTCGQSVIILNTLQIKKWASICGFLRGGLSDGS